MSTSVPNWRVEPSERYQQRLDALAPDDPVRRVLDGLTIEIERSPFPKERSWGLDHEGQTNIYWVIQSEREHSPDLVVQVIFKLWNQKVTLIGFRVPERETDTCSEDTVAESEA